MSGMSEPEQPPVVIVAFLTVLLATLACSRDLPDSSMRGHVTPVGGTPAFSGQENTRHVMQVNDKEIPIQTVPVYGTPTPDPTRSVDEQAGMKMYTIQGGDTMVSIAQDHRVYVEQLMSANNIEESDLLSIGDVLVIPDAFLPMGPSNKLIPDSELIYGPSAASFEVDENVRRLGGHLAHFSETDDLGIARSGAQIVEFVAESYSVNPRILLAILEYQSGWVSSPTIKDSTETYPVGHYYKSREGLLKQLSWAADILNAGFYSWRDESLSVLEFSDGASLAIAPGLNAGTVAVQYLFSHIYGPDLWSKAVALDGLDQSYTSLFGAPFGYSFEPLLPEGLVAPQLKWPWNAHEKWYYTGGPHGGWDSGSAWAAVDFAPPTEQMGCDISSYWVLAAATGPVVRAEDGAVVQDVYGDGIEQTGWTILYMHIDTSDRVQVGQHLVPGDRVGHPSCEGGYSTATHLHFALRYNGMWIPVDDSVVPLVIDGWKFISSGREYDGWIVKGDIRIEAWDLPLERNTIPARGN